MRAASLGGIGRSVLLAWAAAPLGRGLGHETTLVRAVFSYLGRGDIIGFFPERLDTVIYSPSEKKKWRKRGRERKLAREFPKTT